MHPSFLATQVQACVLFRLQRLLASPQEQSTMLTSALCVVRLSGVGYVGLVRPVVRDAVRTRAACVERVPYLGSLLGRRLEDGVPCRTGNHRVSPAANHRNGWLGTHSLLWVRTHSNRATGLLTSPTAWLLRITGHGAVQRLLSTEPKARTRQYPHRGARCQRAGVQDHPERARQDGERATHRGTAFIHLTR